MTPEPKVVPLSSVTSWMSGGTPDRGTPSYWGGKIPWISAATLKWSRISDSDQYLTEEGVRAGSNMAPVGATLVLVRGMALHRQTRIGMATRPVSFNQDVKALVPAHGLLPAFLLYSLQSRSADIRDLVSSAGSGTGVLNTELLQRLPIWIPDEHAQREIVIALADVDDLIAALERMIAKKQTVKQGMMQQLLTGKTRLPGFTAAWRETTVGELADLHRRTVDPRQERTRRFQHFSLPAFDDGEMPGDELGSAIDSIKFLMPTGAVLVSKLNPRIPRIWAPDDISANAIASTEFVVMTPRTRIDRSFFKWLMRSNVITSRMTLLATGTTGSHARIHPRQIAALPVRVPTDEAEQEAIAVVLDGADREIALLHKRLHKARTVKIGMMQELLTGRTRLPVEAAS